MKRHALLTFVLAGFTVMAAAACDTTRDDMGGAAESAAEQGREAGEATSDAARDAGAAVERGVESAGETTAAATTTATIKSALLADQSIEGTDIDVDTNGETRTVTLTGTVATQAQKTAAERIAREHAEGYTIDNRITVR
jgi:hyperosmotically inducible protein